MTNPYADGRFYCMGCGGVDRDPCPNCGGKVRIRPRDPKTPRTGDSRPRDEERSIETINEDTPFIEPLLKMIEIAKKEGRI